MRTKLLALFSVLFFSVSVFAYDFTVDGIYYNKLGEDSVEVTYDGDSYWNGTADYIGSIVIPASVTFEDVTYRVTKIGDNAFYSCSGLTSITIGENITSFGEYSLMYCSDLTTVIWNAKHYPDLEGAYNSPFRTIGSQITSFTFGDKVEHIPAFLCSDMESLTEITIPENVTSIGQQLFYGGYNIQLATVVWNAKQCADFGVYDSAPFENCPITSFTFGDAVEYIPANLCRNMIYLTSITIPNGVTAIGDYVFYYCNRLASITLSETLSSIGNGAFHGCDELTSIFIPQAVTSIGENAFGSTEKVETIEVAEGNSVYQAANNCLIETATKTLIKGCKNSIIPADGSVTIIGENAFSACYGLTEITFPDALTRIEEDAFRYCTGLTSLVIGKNVTTIGRNAFNDCQNLESISISNSVTTIGSGAFSLEECSKLKSIVIGNKVDSIGEEAFLTCSMALESLIVNEGNKKYHSSGNCLIETASKRLLLGCSNSNIPADGSVEIIAPYAFYFCLEGSYIHIPEGVTTIDYGAFYACQRLSKVVIPNSVTTIGFNAFGYCNNLTSITLGSGLKTIGEGAFDAELMMQSVTSLVEIPPVITDNYVFAEPELSTLYVPAGSIEAYKAAPGWSEFSKIEAISSITALTLKTDRVTINPGDRYYLNSIIAPEEAQQTTLVWESDNPDVVSVEDGLVIAHAEGKAKITLSTLDSQLSAQCDIIVAEAGENGENNVVIDPSSESVNFSWPAVEEAASYVFVIYADAEQTEKICTLTFDDQGYLTRIDFLHKPSATRAAQRGFNFVVTGLEENTTYTYTLDSYNSENEVIERKAGQFTTTSNITTELETPYAGSELSPQKVFENGTIYIVRDGEKYTVDGIRVM